MRKFHQFLYKKHFTLVTDHKPLTAILGQKKGIPLFAAVCIQRWRVYTEMESAYRDKHSCYLVTVMTYTFIPPLHMEMQIVCLDFLSPTPQPFETY